MTKKKHLRDLYVKGVVHTVTDDNGDSVTVYLKKLNSAETEEAVRMANAARAKVLISAKDKTSRLYESTLAETLEVDRDQLINYIIAEKLAKAEESYESEHSDKEEWSKDDYLQGLRDSWRSGLNERYTEDAEDEEANKVLKELQRFDEEVAVLVEGEAERLRAEWADTSEEVLRDKTVDILMKIRSDVAWVEEYRKAEVYLGVRDSENIREKYFACREEFDDLEQPVLIDLMKAYRELVVEPQEGKELPETPDS